ncbi:hypothetical protein [Roseibium suaedae]|uniref:Uncharacterized protein n=1 Tax=Roseibium suaedae TaxID=735517 RepID=A0A1M7CAF9_9HYPH|nr:hypothetical protein [Roseibium suaedae]SHL64268.1 hypothetical protein SAMN05444272_1113 [Roseibium suaedae]
MSAEIVRSVIERGDLAHLALFLWAVAASLLGLLLLKELTVSNRRFSEFVQELARLNRLLSGQETGRAGTWGTGRCDSAHEAHADRDQLPRPSDSDDSEKGG